MESARLLQPLQWVDTYFFPFPRPAARSWDGSASIQHCPCCGSCRRAVKLVGAVSNAPRREPSAPHPTPHKPLTNRSSEQRPSPPKETPTKLLRRNASTPSQLKRRSCTSRLHHRCLRGHRPAGPAGKSGTFVSDCGSYEGQQPTPASWQASGPSLRGAPAAPSQAGSGLSPSGALLLILLLLLLLVWLPLPRLLQRLARPRLQLREAPSPPLVKPLA